MLTRMSALALAVFFGAGLLLTSTAHAQTCPVDKTCFYAPPAMPEPSGFSNGYDMVLAASAGTITGVYQLGTKVFVPFEVTAGTPLPIALNDTEDLASGYNVVEKRGAFIVADGPGLSVVQRELSGPWNHSASIKNATFSLGTRFRVGGYALDRSSNAESGFDVVSLYAPFGASVTITAPPGAPDNFFGDAITGKTVTVTLQEAETTLIRTLPGGCGVDMTGALITSDAPVSVISGGRGWSGCGIDGSCGDDGVDHLIPTNGLGTAYVVESYTSAVGRVTVVADVDNTVVTIDGTAVATLAAGEHHRFAPTGATYVQTEPPAYVFQDAGQTTCELGLSIIPPLALNGSTPLNLAFNAPGAGEAAVVIPTALVASLMYDGAALVTPTVTVVPGRSDLSTVLFPITTGTHTVSAGGDFQLGLVTASGGTGLFAYYNTYRVPGCGDGVQSDTEACDDGNLTAGDGCNEACLLEVGSSGCTLDDDCEPAGRCEAGTCEQRCSQDTDCNDDVACTIDSCDQMTGLCANAPPAGTDPADCCSRDVDCDDSDVCTADRCDAGACINAGAYETQGCFLAACPDDQIEPGADDDRSRHADVWTFGTACRLAWNADASAVTFTSEGSIATGEGCASFADPETGELLIYTDGIRVWDGADTQVSTGLGGDPSSLHSGVIVPAPGEVGKVFVFGHGATRSSGVNYQKFDLADGNVVADGAIATIAFPALQGREGMVVAQHANGIDSWVLVSGIDKIFIIKVSADTGVTLAGSVPSMLSVWNNGWSLFAVSHQSDKLVMSGNDGGAIMAWDFDRATGALSGRVEISGGAFSRTQYYGGVFSPDGTKFYFSTLTEGGNVSRFYQYNFEIGSFTTLSTESPGYSHGDARLGPDGKLYIAGSQGTNALHVVETPNAAGTAAGFMRYAMPAPAGCTIQLGLPQIPSPLSRIQLDLSIQVSAPSGTITGTTTTVSGNANAPDGATVVAFVSGPDGFEDQCTATVMNAVWACDADSIGPLGGGAHTIAASVSFEDASACGEGSFTVDARATISGCVWHDLNKDGMYDEMAEPGLGGVTVTLTPDGGMAQSTVTGDDGSYSFADLPAGTSYAVDVDPMDTELQGFGPSPADQASDSRVAPSTVVIAANDNVGVDDVKFGYINGCASMTASGTSCSDGSLCTTGDVCGDGGCVGSRVDCSELDGMCAAGICNPQDGSCFAETRELDGSTCNDGDLCTTSDVCAEGVCAPGAPVVCDAPNVDACEQSLICNSRTGRCDVTSLPLDTPCDDGNMCTTGESCGEDGCSRGQVVDCDDDNSCTTESCDPAMGCLDTGDMEDGSSCNDGSACSQMDRCASGECIGADPVVCEAAGECELPGVCSDETGLCDYANAPDNIRCDDGDACTNDEVCSEGSCGAGTPTVCAAPGVCELDGSCNTATGACEYPPAGGDDPLPIGLTDLGTLGGATSTAAPIYFDPLLKQEVAVAGHSETTDGRVHAYVLGETMVDITPDAAEAQTIGSGGANKVLFVYDDGEGTTMVAMWQSGTVTDLWEAVDIDTAVAANTIDVNGNIAGTGTDGSAHRASNGTITAITGATDDINIRVYALAGDTVTGTVRRDDEDLVFVWTIADGMTAFTAGTPVGLSAAGLVWNDADPAVGAHFRTTAGVVSDLGPNTVARALNDAGRIVGQQQVAGGQQAFVWEAETTTDLGTLGGSNSDALLVDDDGNVAGVADTGLGVAHAFFWAGSGPILDLGALGGGSRPIALSGGVVLGSSSAPTGGAHAFLWTAERGFNDLGTFVAGEPVAAGVIYTFPGAPPRVYASVGHAFLTDRFETGCVACDPGTDVEAPQIVCPVAIATTECSGDSNTIVLPAPSVRDACGLPVTVTSDAPATFGAGGTEVTYTATDSEGNTAMCSVSVIVEDTGAPTLACPVAITVESDADVCGTIIDVNVTATDACDNPAHISVVNDAPAVFPVGTTPVQVTAVDQAGNQTTCDTTVTVLDTSDIRLVCPEVLTVDAPPTACGYDEALTGQRIALCDEDIEIRVDGSYPVGTSVVVFRADGRDDEALTCTTELTVRDVTPPRIRCDAPTSVTWEQLPLAATPTATDICGVTVEVTNFGCTQAELDADVAGVCAAQTDDEGNLMLGRGSVDGYVVTWQVVAEDPSGNQVTEDCSMTVAAALPEPGIDITGLTAKGGGGCQAASHQGFPWVFVLLAGIALMWRRREAGE